MFQLISRFGDPPYRWPIHPGKYILGRDPECDLIIEHKTVSRKHAEIEVVDKDTIRITDLKSHNGTIVNGQRIVKSTRLNPNDSIVLGKVELRLTEGLSSDCPKSPIGFTDFSTETAQATRLPVDQALDLPSARVIEQPGILASFSEMGKMLILPGPEKEMFGRSLEMLGEVIAGDRFAIFLVEEDTGEFRLANCRVTGKESSELFGISRTILNDLLHNRNAILISDTLADSKYAEQQSIVQAKIQSAIAVPLFDEDKILGLLYADTRDPLRHYTEVDLRVTTTFGNILAAKIANCQLLKERQEKEVLESELETASQIQMELLPDEFPMIHGYSFHAFQVQCRSVGGDLYDTCKLKDGRFLILMADVSGKGMGAALLASNILASFRILYDIPDFDILDAVRRVSAQLLSFSRPGDFATLFIGILQPDKHHVQYVNAGHDPPLLVRSDGRIEILETSGLPIGVLDMPGWKMGAIDMKPGDFLFAYTDGITEALNEKNEYFGEERLRALLLESAGLGPESLAEKIVCEVQDFIGDVPQSDDVTLFVLRAE
jgi:serine phosphatase RsbU (regulator of sigma subunit)